MSLQHESLAMFCYFMMGCGFLTGWNAFLTATDFFNAVFPVSDSANLSLMLALVLS
jgi:hypothetical protein